MSLRQAKRVVVAMSGGVDSSVAAYLLREEGYEVIGISLKVWDYDGEKRGKTCCSFKDINDARLVCQHLSIPFYAFNYKEEFQKEVIAPFVSEYYQGRTPNPCILCNNQIKFGRLLNEAEGLGASFLATGHHARICRDDQGIGHLLKGRDAEKDQSYVLYGLSQEGLRKVLLPVGNHTKVEIRKIAAEAGLVTASKEESQDICFIADGDRDRFVRENYPQAKPKEGSFVDFSGNVLGGHKGVHAYTIGQRRGLGIGFGKRRYVTRIDPVKNEVELGEDHQTLSKGLVARDVNWISSPQGELACGVKIRYQKDEIPAELAINEGDRVTLHFKRPARAVTPGQSAVFYNGEEVLGGGIIECALP